MTGIITDLAVCLLMDRLVVEAMGGQYLNSNFSLPCPPGLDIAPEKVNPLTSNSLKVRNSHFAMFLIHLCHVSHGKG